MEQTVVDGVPVFWSDGPAPMTAILTFGCGVRDETFRTIGITHLVEHLAMSTLPRVHYQHNASVDMEVTRFFAVGKPAQLVEFLDTVCRALASPPLDRIAREAGVLTAEGGQPIHPTAAGLLARRYGTTGYGLGWYRGPGYDRFPAELVAAHAARFFTAGNAVLTLTGPPPDGLALPLPAGPRPEHEVSVRLPVDGPLWSPECVPCPGLAMAGPAYSAAWAVGMAVLGERLTTVARREKGLSYDVGMDVADVDPATEDNLIWVDAREGQESEVATILWDTARQLAMFGPDDDEMTHEVAAFVEMSDDPRVGDIELDQRARAELFGYRYRPRAQRLADLTALTPDAVATALSEGLRTALLVVPEPHAVTLSDVDSVRVPAGGCPRLAELPEGQVFRPPLRARMTNAAARRARLVLTADSIALCDDDGDVHLIEFKDIVGVEVHNDTRLVFGRLGCVIPIDPDDFRGAEAAVAAADAATDASVRYLRTDLMP